MNITQYVALNTRLCKACWKCLDACPQKVIGRVNIIVHKHALVKNPERCTGCTQCVKACSYGAFLPLPQL